MGFTHVSVARGLDIVSSCFLVGDLADDLAGFVVDFSADGVAGYFVAFAPFAHGVGFFVEGVG